MYRKPITVFQILFWVFTQSIYWVLMGCVGCIGLALAFVIFYGETLGALKISQLIQQDHAFLKTTLHPGQFWALNHWLSAVPALPTMTKNFKQSIDLRFWQIGFNFFLPYINALLLGTKLLIVRGVLLLHWLNLFLLLGVVGLSDGLSQRFVRRANAGRESGFLYQNTKPLIMFSFIFGVFVELVSPFSIQTNEQILITAAVLFSVTVQQGSKRFKKYI